MRVTFDLIEAAAERGQPLAREALEWISESISGAFTAATGTPFHGLDGGDPCERVAEALAVWLKESAPRRFADMTLTRYEISGVDDSADGMERLRSQSEFILLAYPGESYEMTPEQLAEQWAADINSHAQPDGFNYDAAEHAIRAYAEESAGYLEALLESRRQAVRQALAEAGGDPDGFDPDWPPFRLYVRDSYPESGE